MRYSIAPDSREVNRTPQHCDEVVASRAVEEEVVVFAGVEHLREEPRLKSRESLPQSHLYCVHTVHGHISKIGARREKNIDPCSSLGVIRSDRGQQSIAHEGRGHGLELQNQVSSILPLVVFLLLMSACTPLESRQRCVLIIKK